MALSFQGNTVMPTKFQSPPVCTQKDEISILDYYFILSPLLSSLSSPHKMRLFLGLSYFAPPRGENQEKRIIYCVQYYNHMVRFFIIRLYKLLLLEVPLQVPQLQNWNHDADTKGHDTEPCHSTIGFFTDLSHVSFPASNNQQASRINSKVNTFHVSKDF